MFGTQPESRPYCEETRTFTSPIVPLSFPLQEKSARTLEREEKNRTASREPLLITVDQDCDQEFYIPSVDLLTAQVRQKGFVALLVDRPTSHVLFHLKYLFDYKYFKYWYKCHISLLLGLAVV